MNKAFEKILERLEELKLPFPDNCPSYHGNTDDLIDMTKDIVKEVEEEYNNGWIPCSEMLPDVEADVLLSLRSIDVHTGFMSNTEGYFYVDGEGYVEFENVLAWQPLPEPFKERD